VTDHVVTRSYKPVLVLPHDTLFKVPKRVLYASDFTNDDRDAIAWITEKWKPFEPQIDILHFYSRDKQKSAVVYEEQLHVIDHLRSEFPGLNMVTLEADDLVTGLADYAEENAHDLIAMYSPRRQWWDRMTHSSVTKKVLALRKSPILILK
jgi:nucleotide-binding universal stress UspA family protein